MLQRNKARLSLCIHTLFYVTGEAAGGADSPLDALRRAFERMVSAHHEAALERALREDAAYEKMEAAGGAPFGPLQAQVRQLRREVLDRP